MSKRRPEQPSFNIWQLIWLGVCVWLAIALGGWEGVAAGIIAFWLAAPTFK